MNLRYISRECELGDAPIGARMRVLSIRDEHISNFNLDVHRRLDSLLYGVWVKTSSYDSNARTARSQCRQEGDADDIIGERYLWLPDDAIVEVIHEP